MTRLTSALAMGVRRGTRRRTVMVAASALALVGGWGALTGAAPSAQTPQAVTPPFSGTVWISPDVIASDAPTDLIAVGYAGIEERTTYDRRTDEWVSLRSHIFRASYGCARRIVDVVVNPEFGLAAATAEAQRFAAIVGQLPPGSRRLVEEIWIHGGDFPAGGGGGAILIHADFPEGQVPFIAEVLLHEAAHTSLDTVFGGVVDAAAWKRAQKADPGFVSEYARDFPNREDIAESYGAYALVRASAAVEELRADAAVIGAVIPNRLAYLESLGDAYVPGTTACPIYGASQPPSTVRELRAAPATRALRVTWSAPANLGGASKVNYEYRVNAGPWRPTLGASTKVRGATGTRITVQVRAVNPAGPGRAVAVVGRPR